MKNGVCEVFLPLIAERVDDPGFFRGFYDVRRFRVVCLYLTRFRFIRECVELIEPGTQEPFHIRNGDAFPIHILRSAILRQKEIGIAHGIVPVRIDDLVVICALRCKVRGDPFLCVGNAFVKNLIDRTYYAIQVLCDGGVIVHDHL